MSSAIVFAVILWLGLVPKEAPASTLELTDVVGAKKVKVRAPIGDQPYENLSSPHGQKATYVRHEIDPYAAAAAEVRSKNMHAAIWARAMVEGGGVEGPVQAAYIKLRVAQLASTQGEGKLSE